MPSVSRKQQKFFGMVLGMKRGKVGKGKVRAKGTEEISEETAEEFAGTKHKGLPERVSTKEAVKKASRKIRQAKRK